MQLVPTLLGPGHDLVEERALGIVRSNIHQDVSGIVEVRIAEEAFAIQPKADGFHRLAAVDPARAHVLPDDVARMHSGRARPALARRVAGELDQEVEVGSARIRAREVGGHSRLREGIIAAGRSTLHPQTTAQVARDASTG